VARDLGQAPRDHGAQVNYLGAVIRVLGIITAGYAIWDAVLITADGRHLTYGSQAAWLIIAAAWAVFSVAMIWPQRR
jgi:uncharacterized membrane protein YidH (DUF202 family)